MRSTCVLLLMLLHHSDLGASLRDASMVDTQKSARLLLCSLRNCVAYCPLQSRLERRDHCERSVVWSSGVSERAGPIGRLRLELRGGADSPQRGDVFQEDSTSHRSEFSADSHDPESSEFQPNPRSQRRSMRSKKRKAPPDTPPNRRGRPSKKAVPFDANDAYRMSAGEPAHDVRHGGGRLTEVEEDAEVFQLPLLIALVCAL